MGFQLFLKKALFDYQVLLKYRCRSYVNIKLHKYLIIADNLKIPKLIELMIFENDIKK